ncbi:hypothetical protein [Nocardioides pakistanensis]
MADDHPKVHHLEVLDLILDLYEILDESETIEGIDYLLALPSERGGHPLLVIRDVDGDTRRFRLILSEELAPPGVTPRWGRPA